MKQPRRRFLIQSGAGSAAALFLTPSGNAVAACGLSYPHQGVTFSSMPTWERTTSARMGGSFDKWFRAHALCRLPGGENMVWNFFNPSQGKGNWIYPMLSGKAILWLVHRGDLELAKQLADALLGWQQTREDGMWARSYGAFPSMLEQRPDNTFVAGDYFYSGDNLVIVEALVVMYERTGDARYLNSAIGAGTFLTMVMAQGHRYGMLTEELGAPLYLVRGNGDFQNHIHTNVELLWIGALARLGKATNEPAYCDQVWKAHAFYRKGQHSGGAFYDHYDPGYPPRPYSAKHWSTYQGGGQVLSDNQLRCALGAVRMGEMGMVKKFFDWLRTDNGAVPAYIDMLTGQSGFPKREDIYFDVSSSGLLRSLCQWLDKPAVAKAAIAFLARTQSKNGGWFWGVRREDGKPVRQEQAPVAGFWATADLSPLIT